MSYASGGISRMGGLAAIGSMVDRRQSKGSDANVSMTIEDTAAITHSQQSQTGSAVYPFERHWRSQRAKNNQPSVSYGRGIQGLSSNGNISVNSGHVSSEKDASNFM